MRVVAGTAGSIPLLTPKNDIRPTMDLVRGAVFSMLGDRVPEARVLDLFAGTGAFGIEALSRGAASVRFVESARDCVAVIGRNLEKTKLAAAAHVFESDVFSALDRGVLTPHAPFHLIFADPPYFKRPPDRDHARELLFHPALPGLLAKDGIFVLETASFWKPPPKIGWNIQREKNYGKAAVRFFFPCRDIPIP